MSGQSTGLEAVKTAIKALSHDDQKRLLAELTQLLDIPAEDIALIKMAEASFDFWDNPEDAIYDSL